MNLTRRKFFAGLAVAPLVAVAVAKALPALADNMSLILAKWSPTEYLGTTTIYTSLSIKTWRQLYAGVRLEHQGLTQDDHDLAALIEKYS